MTNNNVSNTKDNFYTVEQAAAIAAESAGQSGGRKKSTPANVYTPTIYNFRSFIDIKRVAQVGASPSAVEIEYKDNMMEDYDINGVIIDGDQPVTLFMPADLRTTKYGDKVIQKSSTEPSFFIPTRTYKEWKSFVDAKFPGSYECQCSSGSANCDNNCSLNGCETNITQAANCGACGIVCTINQACVATGATWACQDTATCTDNIQNGAETGVDCGGPSCSACVAGPTCSDLTRNGGEAGVDCGGSCAPCPDSCGIACEATSGIINTRASSSAPIDLAFQCSKGRLLAVKNAANPGVVLNYSDLRVVCPTVGALEMTAYNSSNNSDPYTLVCSGGFLKKICLNSSTALPPTISTCDDGSIPAGFPAGGVFCNFDGWMHMTASDANGLSAADVLCENNMVMGVRQANNAVDSMFAKLQCCNAGYWWDTNVQSCKANTCLGTRPVGAVPASAFEENSIPVNDTPWSMVTANTAAVCESVCSGAGLVWNGVACARCGNRIIEPGEQCDTDFSGCTSSCQLEVQEVSCVVDDPLKHKLHTPNEKITKTCITPGRDQCEAWSTPTSAVPFGPGGVPVMGAHYDGSSEGPCQYDCNAYTTWNGSACVAPLCGNGRIDRPDEQCDGADGCNAICRWNTEIWPCILPATESPTSAVFNTTGQITCTRVGLWDLVCPGLSSGQPASTTVYSLTPSTTQCRFKCNTGYVWNSSASVCQLSAVMACVLPGSNVAQVLNPPASITQVYNAATAAWSPSGYATYSATPVADSCTYSCNSGNGYFFNGTACVLPSCSDGIINGSEQAVDCGGTCAACVCGSGVVTAGMQCDGGRGCNNCTCLPDYVPTTPPGKACKLQTCNGVAFMGVTRNNGEECDGGNGCENCACQAGWQPTTPPSKDCVRIVCGNGLRDSGEDCDNGANCTACRCNKGYGPTSATSTACQLLPCGTGAVLAGNPLGCSGVPSCELASNYPLNPLGWTTDEVFLYRRGHGWHPSFTTESFVVTKIVTADDFTEDIPLPAGFSSGKIYVAIDNCGVINAVDASGGNTVLDKINTVNGTGCTEDVGWPFASERTVNIAPPAGTAYKSIKIKVIQIKPGNFMSPLGVRYRIQYCGVNP
ncbi:MAG: hypothetical protein HQL20_04650 [Candidatus Omnitrophica bacterium]|nr:hypothetical protein [Candidatus Omnitrophota bacterium]